MTASLKDLHRQLLHLVAVELVGVAAPQLAGGAVVVAAAAVVAVELLPRLLCSRVWSLEEEVGECF